MENGMRTIHPGEILKEEFMIPFNLSANQLAIKLGVPTNRIAQIIKYKRSITGDTALRLAKFFGNSPGFWMNLQSSYDLKIAFEENYERFATIQPIETLTTHY